MKEARHWIDIEKGENNSITIAPYFDAGTDPKYDQYESADVEEQQRYWMLNVMKQLHLLMRLIDIASKIRNNLHHQESKQAVLIDKDNRICFNQGTLTLSIDFRNKIFTLTGEKQIDVDGFRNSLKRRKLDYLMPVELRDNRIKNDSRLDDIKNYLKDGSLNSATTNLTHFSHAGKTAARLQYDSVKCHKHDPCNGSRTEKSAADVAAQQLRVYLKEGHTIKELKQQIDVAFEEGVSVCHQKEEDCSSERKNTVNRKRAIRINFILWFCLRSKIKKLSRKDDQLKSITSAFGLLAETLCESAYDYNAAQASVNPKLQSSCREMFWEDPAINKVRDAAKEIQKTSATIIAASAA